MKVIDIKKLREDFGLSQEQLARHLGVSYVTVSRWERGLTIPSPLAVEKLEIMKHEWESMVSSEQIIPEKGELVFPRRSSEAGTIAHALTDWGLDDWIEKHRPGYIFDWSIVKRYGKGRFEITRIGVKPGGNKRTTRH